MRPQQVGFKPALAAALASLFSQVGCDSNVDEKLALAQLAQTCLVNSDCSTPLVCAFEACHAECETSRDCETGARCVAAARPYKVCQLEEERVCRHTADCAEGLVCGIDGECRDQCVADSECVEDQRCVSGTCADIAELDEIGQLPVAEGMERGSEGSPCVYVSDCSAALLCRERACLAECKADRDCPTGKVCSETRCVDDGNQPVACSYTSDCATERGERCLGGSCLCMCAENRDCPHGQACNGCGCEPDPNAPRACFYNSDCDNPGEICRDRECSCECRQDTDCGDGQACDGCGCVDVRAPVDGVVRGNVSVESSLQLPLYEGATEIIGDLYIGDSVIADLGETFAALQRVKGHITIANNSKLTRLSFPKLAQATWINLYNMPVLETVDLPALESGSLDMGSLENVTTVNVSLFSGGMFQISGASKLKQLALPSATALEGFYLSGIPALEEVHLPELARISSGLSIAPPAQATALRALSAPKLAEVDVSYVVINGTQLTSLADFGRASWTVKANSLQITDNPALSNCEIAELVTRFKAGGFTGSVTASGNLSCPSCQGPNCPN